MSDLNAAALKLAGLTLAFLAVVFVVWWVRRPRPEPAAPRGPRTPRDIRLPKWPGRAESDPEPVAIAPSRLARISRQNDLDWANESETAFEPETEVAPLSAPSLAHAPVVAEPAAPPLAEPASPAIDEAILGALVSDIEEQAHAAENPAPDVATGQPIIRLVPQIPPRDAILRKSWLGGRPRLPAAIDWPQVDGTDGDFLAQIACADLPAGLWEGLGPRTGWLAFFANPDTGAVMALHLAEDGPPRDPPRAAGAAYFRAYDIGSADLAPLTIRAFPEWPVDPLAVQPGDSDPRNADCDTIAALLAAEYDVTDPAFHPFDWDSMAALAAILESRVTRLPTDGTPPDDANDELALAIADAAETNRQAAARIHEIIAIIRESAAQDSGFAPSDAGAVMAALHAIRWTSVSSRPDPESGEDIVEVLTLPLTRHHPAADLWVGDYRAILFDHAKHAWCADPGALSAPARAFFEPLWQAMATRDMASMGNFPSLHVPSFDDERDAVLLELPSSGLMSRNAGSGGNLVLAIRKADLAAADFTRLRPLVSN